MGVNAIKLDSSYAFHVHYGNVLRKKLSGYYYPSSFKISKVK